MRDSSCRPGQRVRGWGGTPGRTGGLPQQAGSEGEGVGGADEGEEHKGQVLEGMRGRGSLGGGGRYA